jgi:hypothetical protein
MPRPAFLITIDVEGDNLWARPRVVTTRNAEFLPRFQRVCEGFGLRPTYLVDYDMASSPAFREFAHDVLRRGVAEIGMHLHAWNTPPLVPLTADDLHYQPYLTEYPPEVIEEKVGVMTAVLEDGIGAKMVSHRAGRWGLSEAYARVLAARGYRADCSVTPLISWRHHRGAPQGAGGPDYSAFPAEAYFLNLRDIRRVGMSGLLEVPMTVVPSHSQIARMLRRAARRTPVAGAAAGRVFPAVRWLRPNGRNRKHLVRIVEDGVANGRGHLEFMLHSSELMPGGSPRFQRAVDIDRLYEDLDALFAVARDRCAALTLAEFRATMPDGKPQRAPAVARSHGHAR